jgi:hypothetical protein
MLETSLPNPSKFRRRGQPGSLLRSVGASRIYATLPQENKGKRQIRTLPEGEVLWLLLKHVLPRRFRRVRDFGFLHTNAKRLIQLLQLALQMAVPPPNPLPERPPVRCDRCGQVMTVLIRLVQPGHHRIC